MKRSLFVFLTLLSPIVILNAQETITARGTVHWIEASICMDNCSIYYLEPDPGYDYMNLTQLSDPSVLQPYVGEHVEVTGSMVTCFMCSALNVNSIQIIDNTQTVQGILYQTEASYCMDGCDPFHIVPDEGFEFTFVRSSTVDLLSHVGQHVEVTGTEVWCVECGALEVSELVVLEPECDPNMIDFNGDGVTDVLDLVLLVNCILNADGCDDCMDYNTDGVINILDIIGIICSIICIEP